MDVETEPIHFTQDDHHSIQERPTHDAPIGSRTPAATGEDNPRKEWKVLVTFSVTPVPMEHSSDLRAKTRSSLWPDCTLSPLSPKVQSEPVGDPVVSDPMYPRDTPVLRQDLTLLGGTDGLVHRELDDQLAIEELWKLVQVSAACRRPLHRMNVRQFLP